MSSIINNFPSQTAVGIGAASSGQYVVWDGSSNFTTLIGVDPYMKGQKILFSKKSDEWGTPQYLFDELNREFGFTLDVCASKDNYKCIGYFTKHDDGLSKDWSNDVCWMNPPYSCIKDWIRKAYEESVKGSIVVALVPARTDTRWFWDYCYQKPNVQIRFLKGRLKFTGGDTKNAAPFP